MRLPDVRGTESMNPHLFVYGSLMSAAAHAMGERLRREARLVGEATIQGRLHRSAGIRARSPAATAASACTAKSMRSRILPAR